MLLIDFTSSLTFIVAMHAYPAIKSTSHFVSCMALLNPNHLGTIIMVLGFSGFKLDYQGFLFLLTDSLGKHYRCKPSTLGHYISQTC